MNNFNSYFTSYQSTDPPPIITDGYKKIKDNYISYGTSFIDSKPTNSQQLRQNEAYMVQNYDPFEISTEKPNTISRENQSNQLNASSIVDTARQFLGTNYSWGGTSPKTGFDCSGLIYYAYKQNGIDIPRTAKEIENTGQEISSLQDAKVGDIICTPGSGQTGKHVKMISRIDNGQIYTIEAKGKKDGIIETPLTNTSNITSIRRILNSESSNSNSIVDYFVSKGLTRNQAKGIYGNLMQESSGNPNARSSDGHYSYGLAQWTGDRKQKLFQMYGNNPTVQQQLDFLWWELNNTHKSALDSIKRTTSVSDATKVFMDKFEKPNAKFANFSKRLRYANSII